MPSMSTFYLDLCCLNRPVATDWDNVGEIHATNPYE
jgi:hypothetical protein